MSDSSEAPRHSSSFMYNLPAEHLSSQGPMARQRLFLTVESSDVPGLHPFGRRLLFHC